MRLLRVGALKKKCAFMYSCVVESDQTLVVWDTDETESPHMYACHIKTIQPLERQSITRGSTARNRLLLDTSSAAKSRKGIKTLLISEHEPHHQTNLSIINNNSYLRHPYPVVTTAPDHPWPSSSTASDTRTVGVA